MINTESKEQIEFRVDDVVYHSVSNCNYKITGLDSDGDYQTKCGSALYANDGTLTLLHRPFKAGDPVESWSHGAGEWMYYGELEEDFEQFDTYLFRHLNPLLRDHSDYKI